MQIIHFALLIVLSMFMFSAQSMHIEESHETRKGIDPVSGFTVEYGCYKSNCWAYCNGLGKMWCYTNKKAGDGKKSCRSDGDCDGYYYKCQGACGL